MILTRKFKKFIKEIVQKGVSRHASEVLSAHQLAPLFYGRPYVPITNWSASFQAMAHLANDIIINRRTAFIEFGSGVSTIIMARLFAMNNIAIPFFSVDDNAEWIEIQKQTLEKENIADRVTFIHAPLIASPLTELGPTTWYDHNIIKEKIGTIKFDLIFVDGPKGEIPYTRFGALPFLVDNIADRFCVFLDDTNRPEERAILSKWREMGNSSDIQFFGVYGVIYSGICFESYPLSSKTKEL